jgi:CheY-like chemotaxis protein
MASETILMAEDEREIREMFKDFLESRGYKVLAVADGEEALEIFSAQYQSIDLVILDAMMPKLNGPEVYDRMKSLSKGLRCLFLTGYSEEIFQRSLDPGFKIPILRKPITFAELDKKVREALGQPRMNKD